MPEYQIEVTVPPTRQVVEVAAGIRGPAGEVSQADLDATIADLALGSAATHAATDFATASQGSKADSAVQPGALGTAASHPATDFATAAQGLKADSAVQPAGLAPYITTTAAAAAYVPLSKVAATVTAAGALVVSRHNPVDATAGALTVTLPTDQPEGTTLSVEKLDATTNTVTVSGSIRGAASTIALQLAHQTVGFVANSTGSWVPTFGHTPLSDLDARYTPEIGSLELVRSTQYGDSWGNNAGASSADLITAFAYRVASRLRMQALTDRSVSATRSDQIQQRIASTWTAPGQGVVFMADNMLNDAFQNRDQTTYKETCRSSMRYLSALNIGAFNASNIQYGPGWAAGVSSTAGAYADIAFNGDSIVIAAQGNTTGGVFRVRDSTGTVRSTVTTSGWSDIFGLTTQLSGFGAGDHTVRVEVVSGTVTLLNSIVPSTTPPLIVWWVPGPLAGAVGTAQNAKVALFRPVAALVAAEFSNIVQVTVDGNWDPDTMLSTDQTHLNDKGNDYVASRIVAGIRNTAFAHGLNRMIVPATYVPPAPSFSTPGATAPPAVTGVTAVTGYQATISWTPGTDGGATLTGYVIEASTDGSTWAQKGTAPASATSLQITSGLTPGVTTYTFRVRATNSVGTGPASAPSSAVTAGPVLTAYSADTLLGSGAMGAALTGGQTWNQYAGTVFARTATDSRPTAIGTSDRGFCTLNDGQSDGVFSLTILSPTGTPGLVFDAIADMSNGYMVWVNSGSSSYVLSKRTAIGTLTPIGTPGAVVTPTTGDVITVVKAGSSITVKVNGVTIFTATDASYSGTNHGMYSYSGTTARFKDWSHTS